MLQLASKKRTSLLQAVLITISVLFLADCSATPGETTVPLPVWTQESLVSTESPTAVFIQPDVEKFSITYVCNCGFVVTHAGKKILIDALYQQDIGVCRSDLPELAKTGQPPFNDADLVLVSHSHPDHFNTQIVGQYLLNTPGAILVAEKSAADTLLRNTASYGSLQQRVHSVELADGQSTTMTVDGIELEIFSAPGDVPNLAYLVKFEGRTIFHTGDVHFNGQTIEDFKNYQLSTRSIDVAFFPYFYMMEIPEPDFLGKYIAARNYVPMHYAAEGGATAVRVIGLQYPEAILFEQPLQVWTELSQ